MNDEGEWGPWIEHDGKGCPCPGKVVEGVYRSGASMIWIAGTQMLRGFTVIGPYRGDFRDCRWSWALKGNVVSDCWQIIRYRIRKPRALLDLIDLVETLPAPVTPDRVDA